MAPGLPLGVNIFIHTYGVRRSRCSSRHQERAVYDLSILQPPGNVPIRRCVPARRQTPHPVREAPGADFRPKWATGVVAKKLALTPPNVVSGRLQRDPTCRECALNAPDLGFDSGGTSRRRCEEMQRTARMAPGLSLGVNIFIHTYGVRRSRCSSRHQELVVYNLGVSQPPGCVLIR